MLAVLEVARKHAVRWHSREGTVGGAETPSAVAIRQAGIEDLPSVLATDPLASDPRRVRRLHQAVGEATCWLAEADGETVGYIVIDERFFDRPFIWLLVVRASSRRRGIGTTLARHAIALHPDRPLFTSTNESNAPSRRLFERLDFIRAGHVDHLDEDDPEVIYVRLP